MSGILVRNVLKFAKYFPIWKKCLFDSISESSPQAFSNWDRKGEKEEEDWSEGVLWLVGREGGDVYFDTSGDW